MIRVEIKLLLIPFLRPLLVEPHLERLTGILMAASGNELHHESLNFAAE